MKDLLFSTPWWLPTLLLVVGLVQFLVGNQRMDGALRNFGILFIVAGLSLTMISWLVDTDVEKLTKRTRQLITAVDQQDWQKFGTMLDDRTHFAIYRGRDAMVSGATASAERAGFHSVQLTSIDAEQKDTVITVDASVLSRQDNPPMSVPTSWRFTWQQAADGWYLDEISVLPDANLKPEQLIGHLVVPTTK